MWNRTGYSAKVSFFLSLFLPLHIVSKRASERKERGKETCIYLASLPLSLSLAQFPPLIFYLSQSPLSCANRRKCSGQRRKKDSWRKKKNSQRSVVFPTESEFKIAGKKSRTILPYLTSKENKWNKDLKQIRTYFWASGNRETSRRRHSLVPTTQE